MPSARILSANRSAKSYVLAGRFFLPYYAVLPYIHPDAIRAIYGANFEIDDRTDVPHIISDYLRSQNLPGANPKNIKRRLNGEATQYMTLEMLKEWDLKNEVLSWICDILQLDISTYI